MTGETQEHAPVNRAGRTRFIILAAMAVLIAVPSHSAAAADVQQKQNALRAKFQVILEKIVKRYNLPGATAAYVLPDGSAEVFAAGFADKETHQKMRPQARMLSGSIGKTFVAASVLKLAQEGRLDLDAKISKWLATEPWFPRLPNREDITLRMLLNHTSGLKDHVKQPEFETAIKDDPRRVLSHEKLISFVLDQPPLFPAGKGFYYSDTNFILAGMIIEKVTGESYYEFIQQKFLAPLALTNTTPSGMKRLSGLVTGYMPSDNFFGIDATRTITHGRMVYAPENEWTGGGLATNSYDLARWARALFEGLALDRDFVKQMLIPGFPPGQASIEDSYRYGLGVMIYKSSVGLMYGHSGWIPGYTSIMWYVPSLKIAVAFQTNGDEGTEYGSITGTIAEASKRTTTDIVGDNAVLEAIRNELLDTVAHAVSNLKDQVHSKCEATPHLGCPGSAPKTSRRPDDGV